MKESNKLEKLGYVTVNKNLFTKTLSGIRFFCEDINDAGTSFELEYKWKDFSDTILFVSLEGLTELESFVVYFKECIAPFLSNVGFYVKNMGTYYSFYTTERLKVSIRPHRKDMIGYYFPPGSENKSPFEVHEDVRMHTLSEIYYWILNRQEDLQK